MKELHLSVRSMFGARTRKGLVALGVNGEEYDLLPDQARAIARWLVEAAEAATQDEALVATCTRMKLDERFAIMALREVRDGRPGRDGHEMGVEGEAG